MPVPNFVPLRLFSAYTMFDGTISAPAIGELARTRGFAAIGLTDRNGLYGSMAFSDGCRSHGVQPLIGTMLGVARPDPWADNIEDIDWLVLYAQDAVGYDNICALVTAAHLEGSVHYGPHVRLDRLRGHSDGLICLTGARDGALVRLIADGQDKYAEYYLGQLQTLFPDRLYIEIARRDDAIETLAESNLLDFADQYDLPIVATNPASYADPEFHAAHGIMRRMDTTGRFEAGDRFGDTHHDWLKSSAEMEEIFADLPEALANSVAIAQRCSVAPPKRKPLVPHTGNGAEVEQRNLQRRAKEGLKSRFARQSIDDPQLRRRYEDRLDCEIEIITELGWISYFTIVADMVQWARAHAIPVGPGYGASAGSLVAWSLSITQIDPLEYGLVFERFLNPERNAPPDFDIDICLERRDEMIAHLLASYGQDQVAAVIAFSRLKARAALKETGRAFRLPSSQVERLARLVPQSSYDPWTIERALNGVDEFRTLYDNDKTTRHLINLALRLENLPYHSAPHSSGIVIGDRPLSQLIPLARDPYSDVPVTQFDVRHVEQAGPMKFDFNGMKALSVIRKTIDILQDERINIDLDTIPLDDEHVWNLYSRGQTSGVFLFQTDGARRSLRAVQPSNFRNLIALISLYRPGPAEHIPTYADRKQSLAPIVYPHPLLENTLTETYGLFIYQEQIIAAAQILAGYTPGRADIMRRAMGKRIKSEIDLERRQFISGCRAHHDIPRDAAVRLFRLLLDNAGYGFLKAHAAAYALLSYQSAWLKMHFKVPFLAASLSYEGEVAFGEEDYFEDVPWEHGDPGSANPDLLYGEIPALGSLEEQADRAELLRLKRAIDVAMEESDLRFGVGHNNPPVSIADVDQSESRAAIALVASVQPAADAIEAALTSPTVDPLIVVREASKLRKALRGLKRHSGLAGEEFSKAFGKTAGEETAKFLLKKIPTYGTILFALNQFLAHLDRWVLTLFAK